MIIKPIHSFSGNDIHLFQNKINAKLVTSFHKKTWTYYVPKVFT